MELKILDVENFLVITLCPKCNHKHSYESEAGRSVRGGDRRRKETEAKMGTSLVVQGSGFNLRLRK